MTEYNIRPATVDDAAALARLRWRFKVEDDGGIHRDEQVFLADCERWLRDRLTGSWLVWVADVDGAICGHVFLNHVEKVPEPSAGADELGYVTNFYVVPQWRNRGVGRALLDEMLVHAHGRNLDTLIVWPSERSAPLYVRAGFRPPLELLEFPVDQA
jgi:ribosomal protein S18 acetylase RimI-like enzyme